MQQVDSISALELPYMYIGMIRAFFAETCERLILKKLSKTLRNILLCS